MLVAKCITRLCADVVQYQRVCATSAFVTPSVDSCMCEKPPVGEVGSVPGTRAGLVPPVWLYASTSSQHVPSAYSRYALLSTTPLSVVTSATPVGHHGVGVGVGVDAGGGAVKSTCRGGIAAVGPSLVPGGLKAKQVHVARAEHSRWQASTVSTAMDKVAPGSSAPSASRQRPSPSARIGISQGRHAAPGREIEGCASGHAAGWLT